MQTKALLESIGIYACEKHYKRTIKALLDERTSYLHENSRLLCELREHVLNFKTENTTKVVVLSNQIQNKFKNIPGEIVTNVVFYAKILDALAVLKSSPTTDAFTLSSFLNVIHYYFPEDYASDISESEKQLYKNIRLLSLFQTRNLTSLKQFCGTQLEDRWQKVEENFKDYALLLVEEGFTSIHNARGNQTTEDAKIREHKWWKEFQRYCPTQESQETDETFKTFVDFIKEKISKKSK